MFNEINEENTRSERDNDIIIGRNAVREALKSGRPADSLIVARGERGGALLPIIAQCREKGIIVKEADVKKLDFMCGHANHQGVILVAAAHEYSSVEDIFALAKERNESPFIVICDSIEDPHNLGAIIRTAECCGVHGIIIPERRSVSLSGIVGKASAGALEYVPVARVTNLVNTINDIKKRGVWVYAADMSGESFRKVDFSGAVAVVVGSEGSGIRPLVRESCDSTVSIPMKGKINSLNVSVAAGILMSAVSAAR